MASDEDERDDDETSAEEGTSDEAEDGAGESSASEGSDANDDGDEGGGEGEPAAPPPSASGTSGPASSKTPARLSAGARVAAAKAAKAAKKAAKKAQIAADAEAASVPSGGAAPAPDEAPIEQLKHSAIGQAASRAGEWAGANQALAYGLAAALVLGMAGYAGFRWYSDNQAQAAGALLAEAVEIATAEIEDEDADDEEAADDDEDAERTYPSVTTRAEAALTAYRRVLSEYPASRAAAWARLGEARALAETGDAEGAREAYATAIRDHGDDALVALRAYEGAGFTYEVEEDWDHAREQYESIEGLEDGAYRVVGAYHLARLRIATGDRVGAQTALEELIEQIETDTEGPESPFPYVLAQAQARLRELDPSSASGSDSPITIGGPGGGGLPEGISPEVLEALRRAMGEAGGGGAPE